MRTNILNYQGMLVNEDRKQPLYHHTHDMEFKTCLDLSEPIKVNMLGSSKQCDIETYSRNLSAFIAWWDYFVKPDLNGFSGFHNVKFELDFQIISSKYKMLDVVMLPSGRSELEERNILKCIKSFYDVWDDEIDSGNEGEISIGVSLYCNLEYFQPQELYIVEDIQVQPNPDDWCLVDDSLVLKGFKFVDNFLYDFGTGTTYTFDKVRKIVATTKTSTTDLPKISLDFVESYVIEPINKARVKFLDNYKPKTINNKIVILD